ncbi:MAG: hypothetical protein FVQ79_13730 [Planctomycetes bacterium]|nr:hypothetical protein [Planctomycetota bacterium]
MPRSLRRNIVNSQIVLLTGAGSTAGIGFPTMIEFLASLKDLISQDANHQAALEILAKLNPNVENDLEALIDAVETYKNTVHGTEIIVDDIGDYEEIEDAFNSLSAFRKMLLDRIVDTYGDVDPKIAESHYSPLWKSLSAATKSTYIPVFTTNYDWSLENFAEARQSVNLNDGFAQPGVRTIWSKDNYSLRANENRAGLADMALFKLHGSTNWYKDSTGEISQIAINDRSLRNRESVLIFPGLTKKETLDEPYQTSYQYFTACLRNCKTLVIIGYNFGDLSIQRVVENAIADDGDFRIIAINGPRFDATDIISSESIRSITKVIPEYFSDDEDSFYLENLNGHLGLSPLVQFEGYNSPKSIGPKQKMDQYQWFDFTVSSHRKRKITVFSIFDAAGVDHSYPNDQSGEQDLRIFTQLGNETKLVNGLTIRKGKQHVYAALPTSVKDPDYAYIGFSDNLAPTYARIK